MAPQDLWYRLPPDVNMWQQFIIANLAQKLPEASRYIQSVEITKFDPVMGDAEGIVRLLDGLANIPILIRRSRLAPMDIMVTKDEEFYPLTESFLQKVFIDKALGEPATMAGDNNVSFPPGPAWRVQHYNTINATNTPKIASSKVRAADLVRQAPDDVRNALRSAIEKSASLKTFFNRHDRDLLCALVEERPAEKEAAAEGDAADTPRLFMLGKVAGVYYCNGEQVEPETAGQLMETFGASPRKKAALLRGEETFCVDLRLNKHYAVVKEASLQPALGIRARRPSGASGLATVLGRDGVPYHGAILRSRVDTYDTLYFRTGADTCRGSEYRNLFITDTFHTTQPDMVIMDQRDLTLEEMQKICKPKYDPAVNDYGIVMNNFSVYGPFRVVSVTKYGRLTVLETLMHDMQNRTFTIGEGPDDYLFYPVPEERREMATHPDSAFDAMPGKVLSVGLGADGHLVVKDTHDNYVNTLYKLMNSLGIGEPDAIEVAKVAMERGKATFKLAASDKKDIDKDKKDKPDSKDSESSKEEGSAPQDEQGSAPQEVAPQEAAPQPQIGGGFDAPEVPGVQVKDPVEFNDLKDIANMNDPSLMDTYLSGRLMEANMAGREQMMQISEDILEAAKALSKLLFMIRMGNVPYVNEADTQVALNKISDIARHIGISANQVSPMQQVKSPVNPTEQPGALRGGQPMGQGQPGLAM